MDGGHGDADAFVAEPDHTHTHTHTHTRPSTTWRFGCPRYPRCFAFLGVRVGETNGNGVIVGSVTGGAAAANAGMRVGNVTLSVDGTPTSTISVLSAVLAELKPGQKVLVVVKHEDGAKTTLQVMLAMYPGN
jgi:C-terminal processing protease CtpA/Prc